MGPPVWLFKVALFYLKCKAGKNAASPSRERFHKKSWFLYSFYLYICSCILQKNPGELKYLLCQNMLIR